MSYRNEYLVTNTIRTGLNTELTEQRKTYYKQAQNEQFVKENVFMPSGKNFPLNMLYSGCKQSANKESLQNFLCKCLALSALKFIQIFKSIVVIIQMAKYTHLTISGAKNIFPALTH